MQQKLHAQMEYIDLTLSTPAENLALDEALLDLCDLGEIGDVLRFWESSQPFVVLGYGNHTDKEVNVDACASAEIPILRRCTGGGTVLQGPGCLNYALVFRIDEHSEVENVSGTNRYIMSKHCALLRDLGFAVEVSGHTDLVLLGESSLKFSGNSQRRKRAAVLFHGTFLYNFDLHLIEQVLKLPSLQPGYRRNRSHLEFVRNIPLAAGALISAIQKSWDAFAKFGKVAPAVVLADELARTKYNLSSWNRKL